MKKILNDTKQSYVLAINVDGKFKYQTNTLDWLPYSYEKICRWYSIESAKSQANKITEAYINKGFENPKITIRKLTETVTIE